MYSTKAATKKITTIGIVIMLIGMQSWGAAVEERDHAFLKSLFKKKDKKTREHLIYETLLSAIEKNDSKALQQLIDTKADVNGCSCNGFTPLLSAVQGGRTEIVAQLIDAEADVNLADRSGCTPLLIASQDGNSEIITQLIASNADVNLVRNNLYGTPLMQAVKRGHIEIVKLLLAAGADAAIIKQKNTALTIALAIGNVEMITIIKKALSQQEDTTNDLYDDKSDTKDVLYDREYVMIFPVLPSETI